MALTLSFNAGMSEIDIELWDHFFSIWDGFGAWLGGGLLTRTWPPDHHSLAPPSHPLRHPVYFTKEPGKQRPLSVPFHLEHLLLPPHLQTPPVSDQPCP